jgi:hypothetical protein
MANVLVPATGPQDWRRLLADPERHWRPDYSAHSLAHCWQDADGFPTTVGALFETSGTFPGAKALIVIPEHKVPLPGGSRPSQSDVWVLARWDGGLISITVEGKAAEPFGPTLHEWYQSPSPGKVVRLDYLLRTLGLAGPLAGEVRYQLLHRTASALIEAERFHARRAVMLVHSFSAAAEGYDDYERFLALFGATAAVGRLAPAGVRGGVELYFGWAHEVS